ncbi:MAG: HAD hydrolase-like protein [Nanoarchaeota archaeon]|nr:HAD hydrolase-like protein [Nanoarchaeota archaeon]
MKKLRGLILDLDGTIIDSRINQYEWLKHCTEDIFNKPFPYKSCSKSFLKKYISSYKKCGLRGLYEMFDIDYNNNSDILWREFNKWKKENPAPIIKDMEETIFEIYNHSRPKPGRATGLRIALNTVNTWPSFENSFYKSGLIKCFDTVITGGDIPDVIDDKGVKKHLLLKPNSYSVEWILDLLNIEPEEALHVGDTPHDIICCQNLKRRNPDGTNEVKAVGVTWGFDTKENLETVNPYKIISNPKQLIKIVEELGGFD